MMAKEMKEWTFTGIAGGSMEAIGFGCHDLLSIMAYHNKHHGMNVTLTDLQPIIDHLVELGAVEKRDGCGFYLSEKGQKAITARSPPRLKR